MNFTTSGYNITGTSGQTLTVGGTITTSDDATISAAVNTAATGTLTKAGTATLTIAGAASFASGTGLSVTGGTLKLVADVVGSSTASISSARFWNTTIRPIHSRRRSRTRGPEHCARPVRGISF